MFYAKNIKSIIVFSIGKKEINIYSILSKLPSETIEINKLLHDNDFSQINANNNLFLFGSK